MRQLALLVALLGCGPDFRVTDGAAPDGGGRDARGSDAARDGGGTCNTALGCVAGSCDALFASVLIDEPFENEAHVVSDWRADFDTVVLVEGAAQFGPHSPPESRYTALRTHTSFPETVTVWTRATRALLDE